MDQASAETNALMGPPPELSPLEQEVLEEYERLAENMKKVSQPSLLYLPGVCVWPF
jgi:DASH complex subunit DAD3